MRIVDTHTIISNLLEMYLEEDIADILKKKYPIFDKDIDRLSDAGLRGGFLRWAVKRLRAGEDIRELIATVLEFQKRKGKLKKKDIFHYEDVDELQRAIESSYRNKIKKPVRKKEADYLYDDGRYLIIYPKTTKAACHFGRGTKWCISATEARNHFLNYGARGRHVYLIIGKGNLGKYKKIAIALDGPRVFELTDITNTPFSLPELKHILGAKYDEMMSIMKKDATTREEPFAYRLARTEDEEVFEQAVEAYKESGDVNYFALLVGNKNTPTDILFKAVEVFGSYPLPPHETKGLIEDLVYHPNTTNKIYDKLVDVHHYPVYNALRKAIRGRWYDPDEKIVDILKATEDVGIEVEDWWEVLGDLKNLPKEAFDFLVSQPHLPLLAADVWVSLMKMPNFNHLEYLKERDVEEYPDLWAAIIQVDEAARKFVVDDLPTMSAGTQHTIAFTLVQFPDTSSDTLRALFDIIKEMADGKVPGWGSEIVHDIVHHPNVTQDILLEVSRWGDGNWVNALVDKVMVNGPKSIPKEAFLNVTDRLYGLSSPSRTEWWPHLLDKWEDHIPEEAFDILANSINLPRVKPQQWKKIVDHLDGDLEWLKGREYTLQIKNIWKNLADSDDPKVLREIYEESHIFPEEDRIPLLFKLSRNPDLPTDVLDEIRQDEAFSARRAEREELERAIRSWDGRDATELAELLNKWDDVVFALEDNLFSAIKYFDFPDADDPGTVRYAYGYTYQVLAMSESGNAVVHYLDPPNHVPRGTRFGVEQDIVPTSVVLRPHATVVRK